MSLLPTLGLVIYFIQFNYYFIYFVLCELKWTVLINLFSGFGLFYTFWELNLPFLCMLRDLIFQTAFYFNRITSDLILF